MEGILMDKKITVAQYGCGKMSKYIMRYVQEKGAEIVAAFDINPDIVGKDIGEITGEEPYGVIIKDSKNAEKILSALKPDVCIITTFSLMNEVTDIFMICAQNGINAISTCEEAFYPWNSSPQITTELDKVAKENNCTLCGSGYQDVFWGNLIATIAGATHTINKIKGSSSYNVEDYGIALAKAHGAGLDLETFKQKIAAADNISESERNELINKGEFAPSYMWNVNGWLCDRLGLTVKSQIQKCIPCTHNKDIHSNTLNMDIPAGNATGMSAIVITETEEGITIESECIGKVYAEDEFDKNDWTIFGEPNTQITINRPSTVELTCASVVNRIPELIKAPAGYITTDKMITNKYKVKALNEYV